MAGTLDIRVMFGRIDFTVIAPVNSRYRPVSPHLRGWDRMTRKAALSAQNVLLAARGSRKVKSRPVGGLSGH